MVAIASITPADLLRLFEGENPPTLIDVREPWEFAYARLEMARLLPLGSIGEWVHALDKQATYVVMCHHGIRSEYACRMLSNLGFAHVANLEGGIDAWSRDVDRRVARY